MTYGDSLVTSNVVSSDLQRSDISVKRNKGEMSCDFNQIES
jgi:hypothetical protein